MIKFVRKYVWYGNTYYDAVHESRRLYTYIEGRLPKTVSAFIDGAKQTEQYDSLYKCNEIIYERTGDE